MWRVAISKGEDLADNSSKHNSQGVGWLGIHEGWGGQIP